MSGGAGRGGAGQVSAIVSGSGRLRSGAPGKQRYLGLALVPSPGQPSPHTGHGAALRRGSGVTPVVRRDTLSSAIRITHARLMSVNARQHFHPPRVIKYPPPNLRKIRVNYETSHVPWSGEYKREREVISLVERCLHTARYVAHACVEVSAKKKREKESILAVFLRFDETS